jgi:hypothetical protein
MSDQDIQEILKQKYGEAAKQAAAGRAAEVANYLAATRSLATSTTPRKLPDCPRN